MSDAEFVYGINPAFELMKAKRREILRIFLSESAKSNPRIAKIAELCGKRQIPLEWMEKGRLISMCESRDNQGVVVYASPYPYVDSREMGQSDRILLLDNLEDPQNVGAILRSAEIFGFSEVFLPLKGSPGIYPSVVKASAGASEHLRIARDRNANQYLKLAKQLGYKIAALDGAGKVELDTLSADAPEKLMLVIGGEDKGVGQFILNEADYVVKLPQLGRINSLNASVAAGVAMYALRNA
ncbi:RNA methyltransferase [bacterium]|nr:RNA methyltransferase [bacterium]